MKSVNVQPFLIPRRLKLNLFMLGKNKWPLWGALSWIMPFPLSMTNALKVFRYSVY